MLAHINTKKNIEIAKTKMNQEIQKQHLIPNWHSRGANDSSLTVLFAAYGLISKAKNNIRICLA